jgi:Ni2+-binding GTPase involved in maturation of urease and hydrogenase
VTTRLVLVGGFLGAGKTTLLWQAAQRLSKRGLRVGLITNDQASELVDTAFLARGEAMVEEVNGSCFCCNFPALLDASSRLAKAEADVLIAEPVGSCTDLSATILQPLKDRHGGEFVVGPLSVMADPTRLRNILDGGTAGLHPSAAYIFRKQIEEADIAIISKADLLTPADLAMLESRIASLCSNATICSVSGKTGTGIDAWLDMVTTRTDAGHRIADVDYDIYAEGEAVLGWLNATVILRGKQTDWAAFADGLLGGLNRRFSQTGAAIGHVKLILDHGKGCVVGNLTGKANATSIYGALPAGGEAKLTLNARVQMPPDELEMLVHEALDATNRPLGLTVTPVAWRCLSPGRPNPTHRYDHVVSRSGC